MLLFSCFFCMTTTFVSTFSEDDDKKIEHIKEAVVAGATLVRKLYQIRDEEVCGTKHFICFFKYEICIFVVFLIIGNIYSLPKSLETILKK